MTGRLSLTVTDELLDELADLLAPRVLARLERTDAPAPIAYTIASLAEDLGVSEKVVRGAIHRGELLAERRGRRYLIEPDAVRAWTRPKASTPRRDSRGRAHAGSGPLQSALARLESAA